MAARKSNWTVVRAGTVMSNVKAHTAMEAVVATLEKDELISNQNDDCSVFEITRDDGGQFNVTVEQK